MTGKPIPPELPASAYVVLGMIQLGRRSGYEIKQAVELSIRYFWTISHAQIYPSLELLERAKLIRGRDTSRGNRVRRSYDLTPAGTRALKDWLGRDEPLLFELRDAGLLKLFFADQLGREDGKRLIEQIRRRSEDQLAQLQAIGPIANSVAEDEGFSYPRKALRLGLAFHQALVAECEAISRELARGKESRKAEH